MRRTVSALLIGLMLMVSISLEAYILVLKNGRKIYSSKPFELREDGVYFTLPNDMLILIKKDDIDFKATEVINKPKTKPAQKKTVNETAEKKAEPVMPPPAITAQSKTDAAQTKIDRPETQPQSLPSTTEAAKAKTTPSKQMQRPKTEVKKPDPGIPVETVNQSSITLDGLIEMARKVDWIYEGKCPICGGTGKSSLSTGSVELVCTYCNGTGKGGNWNDENLKIGDDCPWCVLGYDELSKGPCKNCLGTGRYLGLDKLPIFEIYDNKVASPDSAKNISNNNSKGIRK